MALTPEEKADRARQRKIDKAKQYSIGTYSRKFVAPTFQRMIRAEAGALPNCMTPAIVDGELTAVGRCVGQCVCVTCGKVGMWASGLVDAGHFLPSRRNSILYDEDNIAPQCARCNRFESGSSERFRRWMVAVRGEETIERLELLKHKLVQFSREDLVDMQIGFAARLKAAEATMNE